MKFPLLFLFLVLNPGNILGKNVYFSDDLTFDDLLQTNVTCAYSETCKKEFMDPNRDRSCACDSDCSVFGNCCIDSPYRDNSAPMVECRNVAQSFSQSGFFLVSRCPDEVGSESVWKDLCEKEWNGEDDMMKLAPVSSLDTFVSYKNYYCFKCHEDGDKFIGWDLRIQSDFVDKDKVSEDFSVSYDKEAERWIAATGDEYVLENINWNFELPGILSARPDYCPFSSVSDCHYSWTDEDTRKKCRAYTAIVSSKYNGSVSFKNPHCALCNFEPAENIQCGFIVIGAGFGEKKPFSFAHLLNIHRDDSDKTKKCEANQLWDPYAKKCRRIACAIPGYVVKKGRCTPP